MSGRTAPAGSKAHAERDTDEVHVRGTPSDTTRAVAFAVVWLNHKSAFTHIPTVDRGRHWANLLVLFGTALLPFPTAVISAASRKYNPSDEAVIG
jgi:hypothetical protein